MKAVILIVNDSVNTDVIAETIQLLSQQFGETIPMTVLEGNAMNPKPIKRPIFQQHVEDIITICDTNDNNETNFSIKFWNQIHIGRITREIINKVAEDAEKYPKYLQSRKKAILVVNLCKIAAGVLN